MVQGFPMAANFCFDGDLEGMGSALGYAAEPLQQPNSQPYLEHTATACISSIRLKPYSNLSRNPCRPL